MKKLEKFIKDNNLLFDSIDSGLNSDCTILAGYADYIKADVNDVISSIKKVLPEVNKFEEEMERVFEYAQKNNYGEFWKKPEAKKMYIF